MKRLLITLISLILIIGISTVPVSATEYISDAVITPTDNLTPNLKLGDVNGDGKLSISDARQILVAIANADTADLVSVADMNGDNQLTVADARMLLVKIANGEEE